MNRGITKPRRPARLWRWARRSAVQRINCSPAAGCVAEAPWQHTEAVETTRALMLDPAVPAIFEAAFEHAEVRIRVDVLERLDGGAWGLREVKGSTRVKDYHLDDLAIQAFVLAGAGVPVASIELLHVNKRYVRGSEASAGPLTSPAPM